MDNDPVNLNDGTCKTGDGPDEVSNLSITFERPNPDAIMSEGTDTVTKYLNAGIVLESSGGSKRAVIIRSTGQISVEMITDPI